ncbi:hypothetical protein H6G25_04270 [Dolichospermum sp. FACHB-1091]|uniref:hypothetical protein n=1 Tax=Dolichospermum sp. FACHB-1091 TaxID=2692798 RepID=UPI0016819860|nr:hypothetical protein [Dolichospermum sp. FACHB-1091]MBD2442429.1 hypothetical protein [Dolichospermum sp. FACHB-1091]
MERKKDKIKALSAIPFRSQQQVLIIFFKSDIAGKTGSILKNKTSKPETPKLKQEISVICIFHSLNITIPGVSHKKKLGAIGKNQHRQI